MNEPPVPKVGVIVCTYQRPEGLRCALDSVLAQTYRDFEIIVVDDGSDPPPGLPLGPHETVRWIRTEHRGIGSARAIGLGAVRSEFTAYCDDDDVWEPDHLSTLLGYLFANPEVALAYGDSWTLRAGLPLEAASAIAFDSTLLADYPYISASDAVHRTDVARAAGGFDAARTAFEDWDLWLRMSLVGTLRHVPAVVGKRSWDERCLLAGDHWQEWDAVHRAHQDRLRLAGPAVRHGVLGPRARPAPAPFDARTWTSQRRTLSWYSSLRPNEGYGSVGRQLLLALELQGVEITMAATRNQPPAGFERFYRPDDGSDRLAFYYHYWVEPSALGCQRVVNYSMWESTQVPPAQVAEINRAVALQYVPCQQNVESFRACGVTVPIKVLHHGVDAARFPCLARDRRDHFTFGTFGDLSPRKGIDVLIRAFSDEFAAGEPVQLLLKGSSPASQYAARDPRIHLTAGFLDQSELLEFLRRMDVFVLPSRGEGFGLCGLEAMATGLPLIATAWSGPVEYLDPADSFPLAYRLTEAGGAASNHVRYHGLWAEPDVEHLRYLMRWLFEHPEEARKRGRLAAARVCTGWGWDRPARQIRRDLDEFAGIT
jgi:glycosyltransferase involved in cell wall biosynthesis